MTAKQHTHVALVGAAVALGAIVAAQLAGHPIGAAHLLVCCIATAFVTAKVVNATQRA